MAALPAASKLELDPSVLYASLGLTTDDTQGQRRSQKRKRIRKDDGRLKRPINSFLLFAKQYRAVLLREYGKLNNQQVSKLLGLKWKSMSEAERDPYTKEAEAIHSRFMQEHPDFSWHGDKGSSKSTKDCAKKRNRTASDSSVSLNASSPPFSLPSTSGSNRSLGIDSFPEIGLLAGLNDEDFVREMKALYARTEPAPPSHPTTPQETLALSFPSSPRSCSSPTQPQETAEEVVETGVFGSSFIAWRADRPVPCGFKLVYVPLLVRCKQRDKIPKQEDLVRLAAEVQLTPSLDKLREMSALPQLPSPDSSLFVTAPEVTMQSPVAPSPTPPEADCSLNYKANSINSSSAWMFQAISDEFRPLEFDMMLQCDADSLHHGAELGMPLGQDFLTFPE